jgi:hypothetical protein
VEAKGKNENAEALRGAGLIDDEGEPLPADYYDVIDEMSSDEIEALIAFKQRLDERGIAVVPLTAGYTVERGPIMGPVF